MNFLTEKNELQIQLTPTCEKSIGDTVPVGFFRNFLMGVVNVSDDARIGSQ